jgi:hypothetical protein
MQSTSNQSNPIGPGDPKNSLQAFAGGAFESFRTHGRAPSLRSANALFACAWCAIPRKRAFIQSMQSSF